MGEEEPLPVDHSQLFLEGLRGNPRHQSMGGKADGSPVDAERFLVVVVQEVAEEAGEAVTDIADEADGLAVIGGEVFGEFPVDVVGGEQGVVDGAGEFGRDLDVGQLVVSEGLGEERDFEDRFGVGGVFIGVKGEGRVGGGVPVGGEVEEEGGEGGGEGASRGFPAGFEGFPGGFLVGAHGAFAAEGGMGDTVDELGGFAYGEVDVVGEELAAVEAFVAVSAEVFLEGVGAEAVLVEEEGVAAEALQAVLHGGGGAVQEPGDGAEALTGGQGVVERGIGEGAFGVVIQLERSLSEGFSTGVAAVAGDGANHLGVVGTDAHEG